MEKALERITMGIPSSTLQDITKKRIVAYHEVGHALVAAFTPHTDKIDKITILPQSGGVGGYTRFTPNEEVLDEGLATKKYLFAKIIVALGGRAAETIVFGKNEVTQGASSDLLLVTDIARKMVTQFGFSELGPMALENSNSEVFLTRDFIYNKPSYAEKTNKEVDFQIRTLARKAMSKAIFILSSKRGLMDKLVEVLIDEESIDSNRFYELTNLKI